jgi:hypothetical protein
MNIFTQLYYKFRRMCKAMKLFLLTAGPGIIVMVADNDAGGITTYTATGAKYGMHLLWFLVLLGPVAYYNIDMQDSRCISQFVILLFSTLLQGELYTTGFVNGTKRSFLKAWRD